MMLKNESAASSSQEGRLLWQSGQPDFMFDKFTAPLILSLELLNLMNHVFLQCILDTTALNLFFLRVNMVQFAGERKPFGLLSLRNHEEEQLEL